MIARSRRDTIPGPDATLGATFRLAFGATFKGAFEVRLAAMGEAIAEAALCPTLGSLLCASGGDGLKPFAEPFATDWRALYKT
jgi:hypothetical protein